MIEKSLSGLPLAHLAAAFEKLGDQNTARELLGTMDDPFHSVIVGIVDRVTSTG